MKGAILTFENQILQAITAAMPHDAEIQIAPGIDALNIGVFWKLNDDPSRPHKMSKTISVCVSHEAAQDFSNASATAQDAAYQRIAAFLSAKLATFDPQHDAPIGQMPPVEKWVINSAVVLG